MSRAVLQHLQTMLGAEAGVGWSEVSGNEGVFPDEFTAVARAVPKRQAEFAAGRRAARAALEALGRPGTALPMGEDRAPLWPEGMRGAITHGVGLALAAVLSNGDSPGIDLTEAKALPGDTRRVILPHSLERGLDPLAGRVGFSAKESLFKALYPFVGSYFGFDAACVLPDLETGQFRISLTAPLGRFAGGTTWIGGFVVLEGRVLTAMCVRGS